MIPRVENTVAQIAPGQTWQYAWLFCTIKSVGPKTVTYYGETNGSPWTHRAPHARFLSRWRLTNMPMRARSDASS
jgi:hypothetical protein